MLGAGATFASPSVIPTAALPPTTGRKLTNVVPWVGARCATGLPMDVMMLALWSPTLRSEGGGTAGPCFCSEAPRASAGLGPACSGACPAGCAFAVAPPEAQGAWEELHAALP